MHLIPNQLRQKSRTSIKIWSKVVKRLLQAYLQGGSLQRILIVTCRNQTFGQRSNTIDLESFP